MSADAIHIPVADPGEQEVTIRQNTNPYSDLAGFPPAATYDPIPVYYTFVGAGFYRSANRPVLKWASRDAFAEILYRHLYTAEQRDQFYAYLDIAYNGNRTTADDELLKDGRFMMAGEVLYVRNMYIYTADKVHSLSEHDILNFSLRVTDEQGIATSINHMMQSPGYSRADINRIIRIRYNNRPPQVIANLYLHYCNGLPDLPDIADVCAATHVEHNKDAPPHLSRTKSVANVRRAGMLNTDGTCTLIAIFMMFADIPEIYHECLLAHEALRQALPPGAETEPAQVLTERHLTSKFPIFPYLIGASVSYFNNRSTTKAYRDSAYRSFLALTEYAAQYSNSYTLWDNSANQVYQYSYLLDAAKWQYTPNAGTAIGRAMMVALRDIYQQFPEAPNMHILLQPVRREKGGVGMRVLIWLPPTYSGDYITEYLRAAKTRQQYVMFVNGPTAESKYTQPIPTTYPIRVRNDRTGTDYILISYIGNLHTQRHAVYVNMALRERVDNITSNTTPSAMLATMNRYAAAYSDTNGAQFATHTQSLAYAQLALYHRCDTLPSQTI